MLGNIPAIGNFFNKNVHELGGGFAPPGAGR
jgi:hypothetical protein